MQLVNQSNIKKIRYSFNSQFISNKNKTAKSVFREEEKAWGRRRLVISKMLLVQISISDFTIIFENPIILPAAG